ncbi:MAG TPA: FkbM family methyltransferase [Cyclobacteriaceae bacterium]
MRQLLYAIIYHPFINRIIRNANKALLPVLPKSIKIPPSGTLTVRLKEGSFKFKTNQTNYTTQTVFWKGPYAMEYTAIFEQLIKHCTCFCDIGAHAGYYSLIAAAINPNIRVMSFEPASGPYYYLEENIRINHFQDRVHPYKVALGDTNGTTEFLEATHHKYRYLEHNLLAISNLKEYKVGRTMKKVEVPVATLDDFIREKSEPFPDIIKIDTEGTENLILAKCSEVLDRHPIVICETLFNKIESELEDIMGQRGYRFYNHGNGKLRHVKSIKRQEDDGVRDCFFVHPTKESLIRQFVA